MLDSNSANPMKPWFLRHDLLIELGRLEMAIEETGSSAGAQDQTRLLALRTRHDRLAEALNKLSQTTH